jgi:hypothetical protein
MNWTRRLRWQVAVPVLAGLAALAAAALPAAAQAAGPSGPGAEPKVPVFRGIHGLTAGSAAAQAAPVAPLAGDTPAVAATGNSSEPLVFAYTGSDKHFYFAPLAPSVTATHSLGGSLVGGPGTVFDQAPGGWFTDAFARGSGTNALYVYTGGTPAWFSLGGSLTSRPGAAAGKLSVPGGNAEDAVVRGPDGAVWDREQVAVTFSSSTLKPWRSLGGRTLAGSGPAAVNVGGTLYVLAIGTTGTVWADKSTDGAHWSGWHSLGGRGTGDVGAASPAPGVGVVFIRGTDNVLWYNEFAGTTPGVSRGWHSLGGQLSSGAGAGSKPGGATAVLALGSSGHIYMRTGTWPKLAGWTLVL